MSADELERLRALIAEWEGTGIAMDAKVGALEQTCARLRMERDMLLHVMSMIASMAGWPASGQQRLAQIGADWERDSSLEKWFPFTAEELKRLRASHAELVAALQKYDDHFGDPLKCARAALAKAPKPYADEMIYDTDPQASAE